MKKSCYRLTEQIRKWLCSIPVGTQTCLSSREIQQSSGDMIAYYITRQKVLGIQYSKITDSTYKSPAIGFKLIRSNYLFCGWHLLDQVRYSIGDFSRAQEAHSIQRCRPPLWYTVVPEP